jgi:hypothetical protein
MFGYFIHHCLDQRRGGKNVASYKNHDHLHGKRHELPEPIPPMQDNLLRRCGGKGDGRNEHKSAQDKGKNEGIGSILTHEPIEEIGGCINKSLYHHNVLFLIKENSLSLYSWVMNRQMIFSHYMSLVRHHCLKQFSKVRFYEKGFLKGQSQLLCQKIFSFICTHEIKKYIMSTNTTPLFCTYKSYF